MFALPQQPFKLKWPLFTLAILLGPLACLPTSPTSRLKGSSCTKFKSELNPWTKEGIGKDPFPFTFQNRGQEEQIELIYLGHGAFSHVYRILKWEPKSLRHRLPKADLVMKFARHDQEKFSDLRDYLELKQFGGRFGGLSILKNSDDETIMAMGAYHPGKNLMQLAKTEAPPSAADLLKDRDFIHELKSLFLQPAKLPLAQKYLTDIKPTNVMAQKTHNRWQFAVVDAQFPSAGGRDKNTKFLLRNLVSLHHQVFLLFLALEPPKGSHPLQNAAQKALELVAQVVQNHKDYQPLLEGGLAKKDHDLFEAWTGVVQNDPSTKEAFAKNPTLTIYALEHHSYALSPNPEIRHHYGQRLIDLKYKKGLGHKDREIFALANHLYQKMLALEPRDLK